MNQRQTWRIAGVLALMLVLGPSTGWGQARFDRPGGDYASARVRSGDPAVCATRCERDSRCRAWSFTYPRSHIREAVCYLKNVVPPAKPDDCCISGVRGAALAQSSQGSLEFAIDRFGGDFRSLEIAPDPTGEACAKACQDDPKCRAFTYVRPGYGTPAARCYLKDRITKPRAKPCCISGVVR
jgi:hypothetical protein